MLGRRGGAVIALSLAIVVLTAVGARAQEALDVTADRFAYDRRGMLHAEGHVAFAGAGVTATADALEFDTASRRGMLEGNVVLSGQGFELTAARASLDLAADDAVIDDFKGQWNHRVYMAGAKLDLGRDRVVMTDGYLTMCRDPHPDLTLWAHRVRYYPGASILNLTASNIQVRAWDKTILAWPVVNSTVNEKKPAVHTALSFLPKFGFDAYQGLLTTSQVDFSLGDRSRGSIPISYSTERGFTGALEHVLGVGPGELQDDASFGTPWVAGQGGYRFTNAYRWGYADGSKWEVNMDYRADVNDQAVTRLPEIVWTPAVWNWPDVVSVNAQATGGYLWEETTGIQTTRFGATAAIATPPHPLGPWDSHWFTLNSFATLFGTGPYAGFVADWNHRQTWSPDLDTNETLEFSRNAGSTPFVFDRQYDAERTRFTIDKNWGAPVLTSLVVSFSRVNEQGSFGLEDLALETTLSWHCFGVTFGVHPLVLGTDFQFHLLNF